MCHICVLGFLLFTRNFRGCQSAWRTNSICDYWNECCQCFNDGRSSKLVAVLLSILCITSSAMFGLLLIHWWQLVVLWVDLSVYLFTQIADGYWARRPCIWDVACVCQVPMMDIAGRRPLLLFPMLAMILDLALMSVCLVLQVLSCHFHSTVYLCSCH